MVFYILHLESHKLDHDKYVLDIQVILVILYNLIKNETSIKVPKRKQYALEGLQSY